METVDIVYKIKTARAKEVLLHLERCSDTFRPALTERVNLEDYSSKIFEKAITFEAWSNNILVGLVAAYFNDDSNHSAYITNVSVLGAFTRLGIASRLLLDCVAYAVKKDVKEVKLEVNEENRRAIELYMKFRFIPDGDDNGFLKMKLVTQCG